MTKAPDAARSWDVSGGPEGFLYKAFDWLRQRLNARLSERLWGLVATNGSPIVLEAGSGPGSASRHLRRRGAFAVALDLDHEALAEGRRVDPGLIGVIGDVLRLPLRDSSCDLVWNSSTLEHLTPEERLEAIHEMTRVTKSAGIVFVGVPATSGPLFFQRTIAKTSLGVWIGETFTKDSLHRLISAGGARPEPAAYRYFLRVFIAMWGRKDGSAST